MTPETQPSPTIRVDRQDNIAVIVPSAIETAREHMLEYASTAALAPLRADPPRGIVMDLSQVDNFGSLFLAFLIRCHALAKQQGIRMVVAGASARAHEVLHLTALDTLWDFYQDDTEALRAVGSSA
ncbi:MAG TPA: STAS domain-containing protein [Gemmataceae bacterium]|jgi:anti-anti-sigma factor|nr:STAS domain-containing protein [Gemmataceae bacterium]